MMRAKLPIGVQSFPRIREDGFYYVDKTAHISELVGRGKHYFLSRPRRFGKSLLLDTIKALFEGAEHLFAGLAIHSEWDWSVAHPTVRMSFASGEFRSAHGLTDAISDQLLGLEEIAGIAAKHVTLGARLRHVIGELHRQSGSRVVLLVDEYDKPILDALDLSSQARANRDMLRSMYSVIKDCDEDLEFSFLTGVSKFSKVSLFSGVNNLNDITLDPRYAAICGYTEAELDSVFRAELEGIDRALMRSWYNGYGWRSEEKVYNPFDVLLLFERREFGAWWFETGTPNFLIDTLASHRVPSLTLDGMIASDALLSAFDVDEIAPEALLFQTGYLTITGESDQAGTRFYELGYPNREVRKGLNESLLGWLVQNQSRRESNRAQLVPLLLRADFPGLENLFRAFFASIPSEWLGSNTIANYEGYYASVFYSYFASLDLDITVEDSSMRGRADMSVCIGGQVFLFEFKVIEQAGEGSALAQIKARGYADKYRASTSEVFLLGVEFSSEQRGLVGFHVEAVS